MVITSEGKWRVDRGDEVIIMRAEEDGENSGLLDGMTECSWAGRLNVKGDID